MNINMESLRESNKNGVIKHKMTKLKKNLPLATLALPGFVVLILFRYLPMFGLVLPFKDYKLNLGFLKSDWCGFQNFEFLFKSKDVLIATRNTLLYNIAFIILGIVFGVLIALMLYEMTARYVKVYQTILYLPYFISWVIVSYILKTLLDADSGLMNTIIEKLGGNAVNWYSEKKYWPFIIILSSTWKGLGSNAIMYYAALIGINPEYYEAAKIDGAGKLKQIWYISIPMIKNVIIVLFIMHVGKIMYADFGLFYNLPLNSPLLYPATDVLDTYVYRALLNLGDIGMSSAAAFYQAVIGFVLVVATNLLVKKIDPDSGLF